MTIPGVACGLLVICLLGSTRARADSPDGDTKSPAIATSLALGGSVLGPVLIVVAINNDGYQDTLHDAAIPMLVAGSAVVVFGPSFGNWYAHRAMSPGLALRLGSTAGLLVGGALIASRLIHSDASGAGVAGLVLTLGGLCGLVTGTVLDIGQANGAVETYNRAHTVRQLSIAPVMTRAGGIQHTGLAVIGTF
jgi:hypothetical protein